MTTPVFALIYVVLRPSGDEAEKFQRLSEAFEYAEKTRGIVNCRVVTSDEYFEVLRKETKKK